MWRLLRMMAVSAGVVLITANGASSQTRSPRPVTMRPDTFFKLMRCIDTFGVESVTVVVDPRTAYRLTLPGHGHELFVPAGAVRRPTRITFEVPLEAIERTIGGVHVRADSSVRAFARPLLLSLSYGNCSPIPGRTRAIATVRDGRIDRTARLGGADEEGSSRSAPRQPREDEDGDVRTALPVVLDAP